MTKKPTANERRLAKLLNEIDPGYAQVSWGPNPNLSCGHALAAFLASRGVLAVSAQTVPDDECVELVSYYPTLCGPLVRQTLRRLARGKP